MTVFDKLFKKKQEDGARNMEAEEKMVPPSKVDPEEDVHLFQSATSLEPREHWPHHMDFILACVGYAVGFGSIWRFPYLCYSNGGGAFLIPYIIFMIICGAPLFYLELAIGQFSGASPLAMWDICPLFKGVGWGMIIISGLVCIYYNIILTWVIYYLVVSFASRLPWASCDNAWNTCGCVVTEKLQEIREALNVSDLFTTVAPTVPSEYANLTRSSNPLCNDTWLNKSEVKTASEEYWNYGVLDVSDTANNLGAPRWQLLISLLAAWLIIFLCLCKGVKSVGKVVYVTATSPYLFLAILLVRNCMLPGAWEGIKFYITPEWGKLLDFKIWHAAALQVFFALGPAWGGLITMASFNKFHNNCYRDALLVPVINCLTSIFGGFVIFAVIGYMAVKTGKDVSMVVDKGPGLVFVAYPEAIAQMPLSPLWSVLFFLMLITIGLDSQFGMFETMTSSFIDEFPHKLRRYKTQFVGFMCLLEFVIGLPLITRGGIYIFTIMDWFVGTFALCVIALCELIVICGIYGIQRFRSDIESMIGFKPSYFWVVMWCGITPAALVVILVSLVIQFENPTYGNYVWPSWTLVLGWIMGCASIVSIPVVALYRIYLVKNKTFIERVKYLCQPCGNWGPPKAVKQELEEMHQQQHLHPVVHAGDAAVLLTKENC